MKIIAFPAIGLFMAAQAVAQQADTAKAKTPPTLSTVNVVDTVGRGEYLRQLSRSATKSAALLRDVPQALTPISRELIGDQRMQGMADVVRFIPGVAAAQGEGNR